MKRFISAFSLFILVTIGLYLSKAQQLPSDSMTHKLPSSGEGITLASGEYSEQDSEKTIATTFNPAANYELAMQIRNCRNTPASKEELNSWLDEAQQINEPQEYIEHVLNQFESCSKLHLPNSNYLHLLMGAAETLYDPAIDALWSIPDREYVDLTLPSSATREQLIAARKTFQQQKYKLATAAALTGAELSLLRLIQGYHHYDPDTEQPNPAKALAYANFTLSVTNDNDVYRKADWIKQKLESKLSIESIEQAQLLTEQLHERATLD